METLTLWLLKSARLWGDYGSELINGGCDLGPLGEVLLSRTGPFAPPLFFPSSYVMAVTDEMKSRLAASGLSGVTFRPTIRQHIVEYHWEQWDRSADPVPEVPPSGEPADYIDGRPHSTTAAERMGPIWEVVSPRLADAVPCNERKPWDYEITVRNFDEIKSLDFVRSRKGQWLLVSARAKQWLLDNVADWVRFELIVVPEAGV